MAYLIIFDEWEITLFPKGGGAVHVLKYLKHGATRDMMTEVEKTEIAMKDVKFD